MSSYVKFEMPKELVPPILEMLSVAKDTGKLKKGVNETTKSIERKTAQFVVIAQDVTPEEVVVHLPILCDEKGIPYAFVPTKVELGKAVGIDVGTSSIAVESAGGANEKLQDVIKRLPKQAKEKMPVQAAAPKPPEMHKQEKPKEHKKEEKKTEHKAKK